MKSILKSFFNCLPLAALISVSSMASAAPAAETRLVPEPGPLTLDALVSDVLASNPELRFYEAEQAAAKGERRVAGQAANPELATQFAQKRSTDTAGTLQGEGLAWSVSVSQSFEWPGRMALRKSIANRQVAMADLGLAQFRTALAARARSLGHNLAVALEKAETTRETADRFLALQEIAVQRDPAGVAPLLETRILEANSITYRRRAADALKSTRQALIELNLLRGQPLESTLRVSPGNLRFAALPSLDTLLALARTNNFELRQRALELEQQGFRVDLAKNERYPAVTVAPYYVQESSNGKDRMLGLGFSLPLPLWNQNKGGIEIAKARQDQAQTSLLVTQRTIEQRLLEHATTYEARLREMSHWRIDSVERFREAAELADRHYRLGAVPIATYVEMQKQSLDALDALLETRREAMEAAQQIELATGAQLKLLAPTTGGVQP